ncbi:MAG: type II toxin-antitoxin system Phd/YefM family antitoxin [Proteobacteria bacterium]|nr:type II toxin-antitoxin system Phd/YefM family antitoxin [Pseudomonadota bacterium]
MKTVSKSALKAKMLAYFREVEETGEELVVLNYQKPVLRIIPYTEKKSFDEVFAPYQNKMTYTHPLESATEEEWGDLV